MAQLFHPAWNTLARVALVAVPVVSLLAGVALAYGGGWSDWVTHRANYYEQDPLNSSNIPFSHKTHVGGLGIDCRYCHSSVEQSPSAGMPATETCITCHSQMWIHAPMLAPVRQSWQTQVPLQWNRVYDLPDYVYFDHSIHVANGVGCSTCHGNVGDMPLTERVVDLQMRWCLDCHRDPAKHLRPQDEIFDPKWNEPPDQHNRGLQLMLANHIEAEGLTNCSVCHR